MFNKMLGLLILALCLNIQVFAADIKTSLSHKIVGLNESFTIVFSTQEPITDRPDFTPLNKDFTILSSTQGHHTTIINGKMNQELRWTLVLLSKREGKFIIPSIAFGNVPSQPETIEVTAEKAKDEGDQIFLETELEPKLESYELSQILYTVRLYRSVNISQATLSEIEVNDPDAIIEKVGDDREYEHYHSNGKRYLVLERKYAIFPQKTGELVFSPIIFQGQMITNRHSFFDRSGEFKRVVSEEKKIAVKPIPGPFRRENWFSAKNVALTAEWSADPNNVVLGEPITWTLKITGDGCLGSQIPDLPIQVPSEIRQYPDKPQISNQPKENGLAGVKQVKIALIPSISGEITIPEVSLKWWDLTVNEVKEAKLPATILHVREGLLAMNEPQQSKIIDSLPASTDQTQPVKTASTLIWWLALLNVFWIGALGFIFGKRINHPNPLKHIKRQLKRACAQNHAKQAESLLLEWAAIVFPYDKPLNLLHLKRHVPENFQTSLMDLYANLYGKREEWDGCGLWTVFSTFKSQKTSQNNNKKGLLRDLYPN